MLFCPKDWTKMRVTITLSDSEAPLAARRRVCELGHVETRVELTDPDTGWAAVAKAKEGRA